MAPGQRRGRTVGADGRRSASVAHGMEQDAVSPLRRYRFLFQDGSRGGYAGVDEANSQLESGIDAPIEAGNLVVSDGEYVYAAPGELAAQADMLV